MNNNRLITIKNAHKMYEDLHGLETQKKWYSSAALSTLTEAM
jgi:hypothetical protein